MMESVAT